MKLSTNHRQALIEELRKAIAEKEKLAHVLGRESVKKDIPVAESIEIQDFLNDQRIANIERAIINDDIDY